MLSFPEFLRSNFRLIFLNLIWGNYDFWGALLLFLVIDDDQLRKGLYYHESITSERASSFDFFLYSLIFSLSDSPVNKKIMCTKILSIGL